LKRFIDQQEIRRIVRFCLVGLSNTLVDYLTFAILVYIVHADTYLSQAISFILSTFNSYCLNRRFTFKSRAKMFGKNIVLFYVLNIITMSISIVGLYFFHNTLGIHEIIAKLLTSPFVVSINYLGNRLIIFKTDSQNSNKE